MAQSERAPAVLDLFCGCGGMSWGLEKAGFRTIAGIDSNATALATFARNHTHATVYLRDLSTLEPQAWLDEAGLDPGDIDCIVGGPPCQGFSKNVPRSQRIWDDPRNLLVHRFLEFVGAIRPKVVVMENVAEMVRAFDGAFTREISRLLNDWGYGVGVRVIDAATLGVPQRRRRAFFAASRVGPVAFPAQTHRSAAKINGNAGGLRPFVTVWEAIGDLPSLEHGAGDSPAEYPGPAGSDFQAAMRRDATLIHNHVARPLRPKQHARLSALKPGEGAKQLPDHLRPKSAYSGAYGRLSKDMVARTITRWMFHPGSGRFGHPVDVRTITPREGARLQSFTDDFVFEGSYNEMCSQLGNAVPPLIMERFGPLLLRQLRGEQAALTSQEAHAG